MLFAIVFCTPFVVLGQNTFTLSGNVTNQKGEVLPGASVILKDNNKAVSTNADGNFSFTKLAGRTYQINVTFIGYKPYTQKLTLKSNQKIQVKLESDNLYLNEVEVKENTAYKKEDSRNIEVIDNDFLNENRSGSLMQTMRRLPGISSIDIGSGQSKPAIRGLSFNRVVVAENGVKHEGQEWGSDHGLEIDQYAVERVEVIKGPASLMYGSNAIGGVIDMKQLTVPAEHSWGGKLDIDGKTNNNFIGGSALLFVRGDKFYVKGRFTFSDYADYKVPTDSIEYLTYYFVLKDHRLRNTAGFKRNGSVTAGYVNGNFLSHLTISDFYSKSGFFANAHGLEIRTSSIDYDSFDRDIDLPYQSVNHFKIMSNSSWKKNGYNLNIDLSYQNNLRKEFAEPTSHGYMPTPPDSLEREFDKDTWTINTRLKFAPMGIHQISSGVNFEYQHNEIGGWGFIFPAFQNITTGIFAYDKMKLSEQCILNAGLRYDYGHISIEPYYDWFTSLADDGTEEYMQRAFSTQRTFNNLTWAVGANYNFDSFSVKMNLGKSFRMPIAKELAANGVNYHMYRYEKGDSSLHAEVSYQFDLGMDWKSKRWDITFSPFVNYFPNYIYLNPTADYYEALQVYYHQESEVFRAGGELALNYKMTKDISLSSDAEYIYSIQLSGNKRGFTLPFSPPFSVITGLKYAPEKLAFIQHPEFVIDYKVVAAQNNIVPPEKKTAGYQLINLSVGGDINCSQQQIVINFKVQNLLNTKYYDHTSFYRLIEVPGAGRSFVLSVQIPIGK